MSLSKPDTPRGISGYIFVITSLVLRHVCVALVTALGEFISANLTLGWPFESSHLVCTGGCVLVLHVFVLLIDALCTANGFIHGRIDSYPHESNQQTNKLALHLCRLQGKDTNIHRMLFYQKKRFRLDLILTRLTWFSWQACGILLYIYRTNKRTILLQPTGDLLRMICSGLTT